MHTEVLGLMQRAILQTGIFEPEQISVEEQIAAGYDFKLKDRNGNIVDFNDFRNKTVFMNMWATWCAPCLAEMPDIHSLYSEMGNKDISFVMIAFDKDFDKALAYADGKGFDFPIYKLITSLPPQYNSQSIPATYVISPDGKIVSKRMGMAKYNTQEFKDFLARLNSTPST